MVNSTYKLPLPNPENPIFSAKRFIGRKYNEVQQEIKLVPFKVKEGKSGEAIIVAGGRDYTPPEI